MLHAAQESCHGHAAPVSRRAAHLRAGGGGSIGRGPRAIVHQVVLLPEGVERALRLGRRPPRALGRLLLPPLLLHLHHSRPFQGSAFFPPPASRARRHTRELQGDDDVEGAMEVRLARTMHQALLD